MKQKIKFPVLFTLLLTIVISSFSVFSTFGNATTNDVKNEAIHLWQHYENASMTDAQLLNEVHKNLIKFPLDQNKNSIEFVAIRGLCSLNLNKFKDAETAGLQIIKHNPNYLMGPYLVGSAQVGLKQYASAEKQLLKAIGIDKHFAGPYVDLGELKAKTQKYNESAKYYIQSTMLNPRLNASSICGYKSQLQYINPMLAFKLKLTQKDTLMDSSEFITLATATYQTNPEDMLKNPGAYLNAMNQQMNQITLNKGTPDEAFIQIYAVVYDQVKNAATSSDLAHQLINQSDPSISYQHSDLSTKTIGNDSFSTFTSLEIINERSYKSQTYILSKDGVITRFILYAPTDAGFSAAQKTIATYTRLK